MDATLNLADIRREIDTLDAELRTLLLQRADLVAQVAASKAQSADAPVLRPAREAEQMAALMAWQKNAAPHLALPGVIAIWREIIGLAIAQQGGMEIFVTAQSQLAARAYFGASLTYTPCDDAAEVLQCAAQNKNAIAVLGVDEAPAPLAGQAVFARLPLQATTEAEIEALCYGPEILASDNAAGDAS